jgi:hypothetical protein
VSRLAAALGEIHEALREAGTPMALVGGLAVSARTEPRFTRDVDVAVSVGSDAAAETLLHALQSRGYRVTHLVEQTGAGRLATARLVPPGGDEDGVVVDLLFASSGIEPEIVAEAETLEILPGLVLPVARAGHLLATKVLARDDSTRPQDVGDIKALLQVLDATERQRARTAVRLIVDRGFHRRRDLTHDLEAVLSSE